MGLGLLGHPIHTNLRYAPTANQGAEIPKGSAEHSMIGGRQLMTKRPGLDDCQCKVDMGKAVLPESQVLTGSVVSAIHGRSSVVSGSAMGFMVYPLFHRLAIAPNLPDVPYLVGIKGTKETLTLPLLYLIVIVGLPTLVLPDQYGNRVIVVPKAESQKRLSSSWSQANLSRRYKPEVTRTKADGEKGEG